MWRYGGRSRHLPGAPIDGATAALCALAVGPMPCACLVFMRYLARYVGLLALTGSNAADTPGRHSLTQARAVVGRERSPGRPTRTGVRATRPDQRCPSSERASEARTIVHQSPIVIPDLHGSRHLARPPRPAGASQRWRTALAAGWLPYSGLRRSPASSLCHFRKWRRARPSHSLATLALWPSGMNHPHCKAHLTATER